MPREQPNDRLPEDVVSAFAVAATVDTPYHAAGRGPAVILLSADASLCATLLAEMPRQVRLLVPSLSGRELHLQTVADCSDWLVNFLDALGLHRVCLLADAPFARCATGVAAQCDERVARLILLAAPRPDTARVEDTRDESEAISRLHIPSANDKTAGEMEAEQSAVLTRAVDELVRRIVCPEPAASARDSTP